MNENDEDSDDFHQQWRAINETVPSSTIVFDCWIPPELFDYFNEGDLFTVGSDSQVYRARRETPTHD